MARGGSRPGAGRPKGGHKPLTRAQRELAREAREKLEAQLGTGSLGGSFWGSAHDFLKLVYRDTSYPMDVRMDAAKAAIKYETPALAAVEHKGENGGPIQMVTREMTLQEAAEAYARMIKGG